MIGFARNLGKMVSETKSYYNKNNTNYIVFKPEYIYIACSGRTNSVFFGLFHPCFSLLSPGPSPPALLFQSRPMSSPAATLACEHATHPDSSWFLDKVWSTLLLQTFDVKCLFYYHLTKGKLLLSFAHISLPDQRRHHFNLAKSSLFSVPLKS